MKSEQILEALSKLDPENNDHWTQDGSPRLGAVGDGVSRADILAAAPLFNRKNTETAAERLEEVVTEKLDKADSIKEQKAVAESKIRAAIAAMQAAKADLDAANAELNEAAEAEKQLDTRSDTELNQAFLQKDFELRLEKAAQRKQAMKLLEMAGVDGKDVKLYGLGVADRAIAEANIRKRKEAAKAR